MGYHYYNIIFMFILVDKPVRSYINNKLCCKLQEDLYYPHPLVQDMLWGFLHKVGEPLLTKWPFSRLRSSALNSIMQLIHFEDESTHYICLGPVNKVCSIIIIIIITIIIMKRFYSIFRYLFCQSKHFKWFC